MPHLSERFDHYAKDFFRDAFYDKKSDFLPLVEIREKSQLYEILAELPGIEVGNIQLRLEDNCLIIEGEKYHDQAVESILSECDYGHFYRWIPLKEDVDNDKISAELVKGILKVTLSKKNDGLDDYRKIKILKTTS